ncbi:hypothetical protein A3J15_00070 [Candidatus Roizmanbacteria bacterium RIFCSPLOWO2_02_FULL_38_10]|uniref:Glycosyl transferase family 1 domain-containing protein n=1 Tax=Candidatus Roizmanbacteria bacterium RIFCSPLOWO2_02_FULL_38_10 TaxID=1802074 RepID=A0A1F7JL35_9BACT|nr:MAG: hypothetical protein A3J15_00070 [Candidatus Roizmanbacteria bacterium RIFCSPLOWO2_02_FULL_38_10]
MSILLIRGAFLNRYEGQNYEPLANKHNVIGIGSYTSIHDSYKFPVVKLLSPYDLVNKSGDMIGRPLRWFFNRTLGDSHFLFGFENWVKQHGPIDIAHIAETHYGYDLQTIQLKKKGLIRKVISTCWETIPFNNETVGKKRRIKQIVRENVDHFICPTQRAKEALIQEGVSDSKINVIRVGVDLKLFKPKPNLKKKKSSIIKLLFVGRLVEEKGVYDVIEFFSQLVKNQNITLTLAGSGPMSIPINRLIGINKWEKKVKIVQSKYDEIPRLYQDHDILIAPSKTTNTWEEQYGMVLVEAMACGLPIIAYDSGAISEVLGNAGVLISEDHKSSLYQGLKMLINDEFSRYKYSLMAIQRSKLKFDRVKISSQIRQVYNSVLAGEKVGSPKSSAANI